MKALVVDDSKTMCEMVGVTLKGLGFEVTICNDGDEAVNVTEKNTFDLVVTDINMPNMDGIELIRHLRSQESYKFTPILVLTTEGGDNAKQQGKSAGATGWIVKPFKPPVLVAAAKKVCGLN